MSTIKFRKQYKPVGFGDAPSARTAEGKRIAAQKAAETRAFNRIVKDRQEAEAMDQGLQARLLRLVSETCARLLPCLPNSRRTAC
jgi:hypothetical protein